MKNIRFLGIGFLLCLISCKETENKEVSVDLTTPNITSYYFIRHAEKDSSDALNKNPHLCEKGYLRAQKWIETFKGIPFHAVYTTHFHRTQETALPSAKKHNLDLTFYELETLDLTHFLKNTKNQNVLIVGHSNTTPEFVNRIIKMNKYPPISDDNYANFYEVKIVDNKITSSQSKMP
jgi:broad specificity phosphatase PhoE